MSDTDLSPAHEPLLATKLFVPRTRAKVTPRSTLLDRLDHCRDCGLLLVSAPAGYGKTTLLSTWVQTQSASCAWLSLDAADNDPVRFLRYVVAALQQVDHSVGDALQTALDLPQPPPPLVLMHALINDLAARSSRAYILVLDDFQVIEEAAVHELVQTLVTHRPASLQLVIATREDPPLPLARLRARGELGEVRALELRFSRTETAQFLRDVMGLSLSDHMIELLDTQVEGWAAGLQLAGLSLQQGDPNAVLASLSGGHHFILNYLAEEVLRRLPPKQRDFLLDTSILPRLSGPLCDAVLERSDSADLLEELYASNIFVAPLDDAHNWWRYHHLFADLLAAQLRRTRPARAAEVRSRASAWFDARGDAGDAIELAFAAEDYATAVGLLEIHGRRIIQQGYARTVETWLNRLPDAWRSAGVHTNLAFVWSLLLRGRLDDVDAYLLRAEQAVHDAAPDAASAIRSETMVLRAVLAALRGQAEQGCGMAEAALALAPEDDTHLRGTILFGLGTVYNYAGRTGDAVTAYRAALPLCRASGNTVAAMLIVSNMAMLYLARGQLRAAAARCQQVIDAAVQAGAAASPALASVYGAYSGVLFEWMQFDAALVSSERALAAAHLGGHVAALAYGSVVHSRILQALGQLDEADAVLAQALPLRERRMPAWVNPHLVAQQAALALARGDDEGAAHILALSGVAPTDAPHQTTEVIHLAWLRLMLHQARTAAQRDHLLDNACETASRVLASAYAADRMGAALETLILRAMVQDAQGDAAAAANDARQALLLAESEGYVRLFVDAGEPMRRIIHALRSELAARSVRGETDLSLSYLDDLLDRYAPEASAQQQTTTAVRADHQPPAPATQAPPGALVESLSARELDVLRLMAEGLTYQEAADRLIVSVNTIRFHVKALYGKLGVDKRIAAIDAARRLGLL